MLNQQTLFFLAKLIYRHDNSDEFKTYLCDYKYKGATWSVEIKATSFDDAQKRLGALVRGEIVGELKFSIPVPLKESWFNKVKKIIVGRS